MAAQMAQPGGQAAARTAEAEDRGTARAAVSIASAAARRAELGARAGARAAAGSWAGARVPRPAWDLPLPPATTVAAAAFIDARDIGDVAALVLANPGPHRGAAYLLTGPAALDFEQVAALLTSELGRPIRYEPTSAVRYVRHVHAQGRPWLQALVQTVLHMGLRRGQAETVDPTLERLLGRPGRTLAAYIHDNKPTWAK